MRTLKDIDNKIAKLAEIKTCQLEESPLNRILSHHEIVALQSNSMFGDKFREMHALLSEIEMFFRAKFNSPEEEAQNKKTLVEKIAQI